MTTDDEFQEINPKAAAEVPTAAQVSAGVPMPAVRILQIMSSSDWEDFTEEWLDYHKSQGSYHSVRKYRGPGDLGLDIVAFTSVAGFKAPWDSFQCKHYDHALQPGDIWSEVGKIIYHSFKKTAPFNQVCRVPRRHVFIAPFGVGIKFGRLLKDPDRFKEEVRKVWDTHCMPKIAAKLTAPLKGDLLAYFDAFDFSIFEDRTSVQLVADHAKTPFYAPRFGGGLPPRRSVAGPPEEPTKAESLYLKKILGAYEDHLGNKLSEAHDLEKHADLKGHYDRQRVLFYSAESLRNFARDRTPPMTFDSLQDDVYHGVIDVCEAAHSNGLERLRATVSKAASVDVAGNALVSVTRVTDKQGICHQLANDDRITWVDDDE